MVLLVGDEAVPSVIGHTGEESKAAECAWMFKKEHLALEEVAVILDRVNREKRDADKKRGKRVHEFFVPNGSKILVGSYVHLRREGLEGYMNDFNTMVRSVREVTGDTGIEVLPVAPVVFEGVDEIGKSLIFGVREWIKWIGEKTGRDEVGELGETGGRETDDSAGMTVIWRPAFMAAHGKQSGFSVLKDRGNTLTLVRDGRVEWTPKQAGLAKEIQRLTTGGKKTDDRSEKDLTAERDESGGQNEQDRRDSFAKGVSIEGEFAFVRAVSNFCKKGVRDGRYKGNYSFNVKGQMEMRELIEQRGNKSSSVSLCIVGGSQMGRLAKEISSGEGLGLKMVGEVRVKGRLEENVVELLWKSWHRCRSNRRRC